MNKVHRLIWNQVTQSWVAVAECARGRGKGSSRKLVAAALSLSTFAALGAPVGGQVSAGSGSVTQTGSATTINQSSANLSLNWKSFNIASTESVQFVQPSSSSVAVNRIFDTNGSQIMGRLSANGQVYLINPNGILFGQGAQINVGSLVASTLGLNDAQFNTAARSFSGAGVGSISNQGLINAAQGGYIALLGNTVSNTGTLNAPLGTVALGGGSATTLTFANNRLVGMQIEQSVLNTLVANGGLIKADGGLVMLSAGAKDAALASVVNNTGQIRAQTVNNQAGIITLLGGMAAGTVNVGGTLDASAPNGGDSGFIETSAAQVKIAEGVNITTAATSGKTGNWLIDPVDFTVAASGGNITGQQLSNNLTNSSIEILSSAGTTVTSGGGNVNVNDAVSWSANTILTLTASNNVNINANISATGNTAGLVLKPNTTNGGVPASGTGIYNLKMGSAITLSGITPSLSIAGNSYTVINNFGLAGSTATSDFEAIKTTGFYALGKNLDASNVAVAPISSFSGTFDGLGHTITGVVLNFAPATTAMGLFVTTGLGSVIQNVGLVGGSVSAGVNSGGLVGENYGSISNSFNTGSVSGEAGTGGLVGRNEAGTIRNSYATGAVIGAVSTGGLVGFNNSGLITDNYATGSVTSTAAAIGGLVGQSVTGDIINSYAAGRVQGATGVGGLLGNGTSGKVTGNYATGKVFGTTNTGGLVGSITSGVISKSYATGDIAGTTSTGGLVGLTTGAINTSYATGNVTGATNTGGLVANSTGNTVDTYATGNVIGAAGSSGGLVGITTGSVGSSYAAGSSSSGITNGLIGSTSVPAQVTNSYFDKTLNNGVGTGTPLTTLEMKSMSKFAGFSIADKSSANTTWRIYEGVTMPLLSNFLIPLELFSAYNGPQPALMANIGAYTGSSTVDATKLITSSAGLTLSSTGTAGEETAMLSGFGSVQQGYDISYAPTTITGTGSLANDLNISTPINWTSGNLTLIAQNNIYISSELNGSGTAKLALNFGQGTAAGGNSDYAVAAPVNLSAGANFSTLKGTTGTKKEFTVITDLGAAADITTLPAIATLQSIAKASNLGNNYALGKDINALPTSLVTYNGTSGFMPIGVTGSPFTGYFDGLGHKIDSMTINIPAGANVGLIGAAGAGSDIRNVGLTGGNVLGGAGTGGLVGSNTSGNISNSYNTGAVIGGAGTGGLVGTNVDGAISRSYSTGSVTGEAYTGGLVGSTTTGPISDSYATGNVIGGPTTRAAGVGGLVGTVTTGNLTNNHATGSVTGAAGTGGLAGTVTTATVSNNYATGSVTGAAGTGGLIGTITTGTITGSFAMGAVNGAAYTGGLVGSTTGPINNSFASGAVTAPAYLGGLVGTTTSNIDTSFATGSVTGTGTDVGGLAGSAAGGVINNTYASGDVSGVTNVGGLIGATTNKVSNSYVSGKVSNSGTVLTTTGGMFGTSTVALFNNFWDNSIYGALTPPDPIGSKVAGSVAAAGITGITRTQLTSIDFPTVSANSTWDFTNTPPIWLMQAGYTPILNQTIATFTVTANDVSKSYDGKVYSGGYSASYANAPAGFVNKGVTYTGEALTATNAGTYTITPVLLDNPQYLVKYVNGTLTINKASTSAVSMAGTRAYDGTAVVAANIFTLTGMLNGDTLGLMGAGTVADKNVGADKAVTLGTLALTDAVNGTGLASNYTFVGGTQTATITAANVTAAATRAYDGTFNVNASLFSLTGLATGETLSLTGNATVASKNAALTSQPIDLNTLALANTSTAKASNYSLASGSALIMPAQLTASVNPYSKVFDNTLAAAPTFNITGGLIGSETVLANGVATFNGKDVLSANLITFSSTQLADGTQGGLASNYKLPSSGVFAAGQTMGASITPKTLNVTVTNTGNKIYNGLTDTSVTLSSDALTDDIQIVPVPNFNGGAYVVMSSVGGVNTVSITNSAANFDNKNVGTDKTITVSGLTISGANKANYKLASTIATTTGTVAAKDITVAALGKNKVYDATNNDLVTLSSTGVVLGDRPTFSSTSATFDAGKDVSLVGTVVTAKAVTVSGITINDTNYRLNNTTATTTATITPKAIGVTAAGIGKEYDGTLTDEVTLASTGILSADGVKDAIGFSKTSAVFATKTAGASKAVTVSGITLTGTDKGNYTLSNTTAKTTATITQKLITVNAAGIGKVYDGNLIDTVTLSGTGLVLGDTVTFSNTSANFADKNVGENKEVTVNGIRLSGLDSANYKANTAATTTANITPKAITVTATGINKVYDATLNDAVTLKATGMISGDAYGLSSTSALFADKNVGVGKVVTVNGITVTGVNAGNYSTNTTATTKATVTPKVIVVTAAGIDKVYDGTLNDEVTLKSTGLIEGDVVTLTKTSALFATNTAGTGKAVSVKGIALEGTDAGNYKGNATATTSASITK